MREDLTSQISELFDACKDLTVKGYTVEDKVSEVGEYCRFILTKMLIYLAMVDKKAAKTEVELINSLMGLNVTAADVEGFAGNKTITANEVTQGLQKLGAVFAKAEFEERCGFATDKLVSLINTIGVEMAAADGCADETETAQLSSMTFRLRIFVDSYLKSLKEKSRKKGAEAQSSDKPAVKSDDKQETLEELLKKLNSLIGLTEVKEEINSLSNLIKVRKLRQERGYEQPEMSLHLVFTGNPGTGKTTVARLLSKIYNRLGVIRTDKLVEVDRSGLVSGFVGKTALKTKEVCESALGGVLFIDEAYALTNTESKNDFGAEAVNTLLKFMEDNRSDFVLICAGYTDLMEQFLDSNPGLRSRFNRFIYFRDYTPEELTQIYVSLCRSYKLEPDFDAIEHVRSFFEARIASKPEFFANGRDARNLFERTLSNQADRLSQMENISDEQLVRITLEDVKDIEL